MPLRCLCPRAQPLTPAHDVHRSLHHHSCLPLFALQMKMIITILGTFSAVAFTISRFMQMSGGG